MSKSRRRRINDAGTPTVAWAPNGAVLVSVCPAGKPDHTVSFEMKFWQFRNFARDVRQQARNYAASLRSNAEATIAYTTETS